jgi:hypothetical protein
MNSQNTLKNYMAKNPSVCYTDDGRKGQNAIGARWTRGLRSCPFLLFSTLKQA